MLFSPSDYNTQVPGLVFGPELLLKEVKPKVSYPSLPSKTFSRAKRERIRKGLIGERTLMKEEKKARQAARRAEKRLARGGDGERKSAVKRVYRCKESVDATIRKVLGIYIYMTYTSADPGLRCVLCALHAKLTTFSDFRRVHSLIQLLQSHEQCYAVVRLEEGGGSTCTVQAPIYSSSSCSNLPSSCLASCGGAKVARV